MLGRQPPAGCAAPAWLAGCDLLVQPVAAAAAAARVPPSPGGSADVSNGTGQCNGAARAGAVAGSAAAKHLVLTGACRAFRHVFVRSLGGRICHHPGCGLIEKERREQHQVYMPGTPGRWSCLRRVPGGVSRAGASG